MKAVVYKGETIYSGKHVDIPKVYQAVTGSKLDMKAYRENGLLDGLFVTDFYNKHDITIQCWDKPAKYGKEA